MAIPNSEAHQCLMVLKFQVVVTVSTVKQQIRPFTQSPTHHFLCRDSKFFRACLPKLCSLPSGKYPWCVSSKIWCPKNILERQVDCLVVLPRDFPVIHQIVVEAGWWRETQRPPRNCTGFEGHTQGFQYCCFLQRSGLLRPTRVRQERHHTHNCQIPK